MSPHRKAVCSLLDNSGRALHRSEIIQHFPALIWHSGLDARCDYFNQTWLAFTGRSLEQELGDGWADGVHPDDLAGCLKTYLEAFDARQQFVMEYRLRHHDGSYRWILDHGCPHYAMDGSFCGYIGSCYDITQQKERESSLRLQQAQLEQQVDEHISALQQSHDLLNTLSDQMPGGIYQFQLLSDGRYTLPYASRSMIELFGVDLEQARQDAAHLFERVLPEDLPGLLDSIQLSARNLTAWHYEFRGTVPQRGMRWLMADSRPQRQQDGSVIWHGFITDVTEYRQLEQQLFEARRLESIGQIAAGVAHEVRNPLNAILTVTEALFLEPELRDTPSLEPYIQHIRAQVNRLAQLMQDLLDLGRPLSPASLLPVPLAELLRQTAQLWQQTGVATDHRLELLIPAECESLQVLGDADRLQQVIFNLLENAGQHSPPGGTVRLILDGPVSAREATAVRFRIVDRGEGIAPDLLERVFEPFFSMRKGGTGLGLALVKQFLEQMGGSVEIALNAPDPGCTVSVQLQPLQPEEAA